MTQQELNQSVKLSKTSKLPCHSWSLKAGAHCAVTCSYCYAKRGRYLFPAVIAAQGWRNNDWRRPDWTTRMIKALEHQPLFRLFDSGDFYTQRLADKWADVCEATPNTKYWAATKAGQVVNLERLESLANVTLRHSLGVNAERPRRSSPHLYSMITTLGIEYKSILPPTAWAWGLPGWGLKACRIHLCQADKIGQELGKGHAYCGPCRACWDKAVELILYKLR